MAIPSDDDDYFQMLGAFTAAFAQLEVDLRRAAAADVTLPPAGVRRRLAERPRAVGNADVFRALARSGAHPVPRPLLIDLFRLNELRVRVVHRAARPTISELTRSLATMAAAHRWLAVHRRRLTAWSVDGRSHAWSTCDEQRASIGRRP